MLKALVCGALFVVGCTIGCALPSDDGDDATTSDAITGSIAVARARQIREAYLAAPLSAFRPLSADKLPAAARRLTSQWTIGMDRPLLGIETFTVKGIGPVHVVELGHSGGGPSRDLFFFDGTGAARAVALCSGKTEFYLPLLTADGKVTMLEHLP